MVSDLLEWNVRKIGYRNYRAFTASQEWKAFCDGVRAPHCYCCKSTERLCVHHTTYERLGKELPCDVVTLCNGCHKRVHALCKQKQAKLADAHIVLRRMRGAPPPKPRDVLHLPWTQNGRWNRWLAALLSQDSPAIPSTEADLKATLLRLRVIRESGRPTHLAIAAHLVREDGGVWHWHKKRIHKLLEMLAAGKRVSWFEREQARHGPLGEEAKP